MRLQSIEETLLAGDQSQSESHPLISSYSHIMLLQVTSCLGRRGLHAQTEKAGRSWRSCLNVLSIWPGLNISSFSHEYCLPQCANYIESPTGNQIQSVLSFPPHCEVHRPHYDTQDTPEWYSPWINSAKGFSIRATHTRENHEVWGKISRICRRVGQFIQACAITAQT